MRRAVMMEPSDKPCIANNILRTAIKLKKSPPKQWAVIYSQPWCDIQKLMGYYLIGSFDHGLGTLDQLVDLANHFGCTLDELLVDTMYEGEGRILLPRSRVARDEPVGCEEDARELEIIRLKAKLFDLLYAKEVLPCQHSERT